MIWLYVTIFILSLALQALLYKDKEKEILSGNTGRVSVFLHPLNDSFLKIESYYKKIKFYFSFHTLFLFSRMLFEIFFQAFSFVYSKIVSYFEKKHPVVMTTLRGKPKESIILRKDLINHPIKTPLK